MAAATATAVGGQVRSRAVRRTCWRLAVLLGLSWAALLLLGGTAHAACDDATCEQPAAPAQPGAEVPMVGELLANADEPTTPQPLRQVADLTATALDGLRGTTPAHTPDPAAAVDALPALPAAGAHTPAAAAPSTGVDAAGLLTNTVRDTVEATGEKLTLKDVPSIRATVTPLVDSLTRQVVGTADDAVDTVETLAAPLPLAGGLAQTLRTAVGTLSLASQLAVDATDAVTGSVDEVVGTTAAVIAPVVEQVTHPAGTGDSAGPTTGAGPAPSAADAATGPALGVVTVRLDAPHADLASGTRTLSGPAVPPPDAVALTPVAQPAADTVTALPVPVSGAGFTPGNGGAASAPRPDHPLARVAPEPLAARPATAPVACPAGPMPGTPAADPAFSPD